MKYFNVKCASCGATDALPTNLDNSLNKKGWTSHRPPHSELYVWTCQVCNGNDLSHWDQLEDDDEVTYGDMVTS